MALERRKQREELVGIIDAGRELSPEHDYELADLYLTSMRLAPPTESALSRLLTHPRRLRVLAASVCLAFAGLTFPILAMHMGQGGSASQTSLVSPGPLSPDQVDRGGDEWWG